MIRWVCAVFFLFNVAAVWAQDQNPGTSIVVTIAGGSHGIGFDDMGYSAELHRVLVPAGHTGKLVLIDPSNLSINSIAGFSSSPDFEKGHKTGISSVDENNGDVFVPDHGTHQLDIIDGQNGAFKAKADLHGEPDFVRYVRKTKELWVTEPDNDRHPQIEVYGLNDAQTDLRHARNIRVPDGPESLTIDQDKGLAYTNFGAKTGVIDAATDRIIDQWPNTCQKAHGTVLDTQRGFLFVACGEGKIVVLDTQHRGKILSSLNVGAGVDLIDYNARLKHLYVPSSKAATLSVLSVSDAGQLSLTSQAPSVDHGHCVVSDDQNNIWVCDPNHGQLLRYQDI